MPSINGFTVGSARRIGVRSFRVPGTRVSLPVRAEVAPLLIGLAADFHRTVEPLVPGWNWGYAYRNVKGRSTASFHAAGIAIDLNAPRHPLGRRNTFNASQRAQIRALARKYGCRWGGDYRGRKDEMHFEVIVPRAVALRMAGQKQTPSGPPPPRPGGGGGGGRVAEDGKLGPATVRELQRDLGVPADGWFRMRRRNLPNFGPNTNRALQRRVGARADGDLGPATVRAMQARLGIGQDGAWGSGTTRALQRRLNRGSL